MPTYVVRAAISYRVEDPEGRTIWQSLARRGYGEVASVKAGKYLEFVVVAGSPGEAADVVARIAREARLYNPAVHVFRILGVHDSGD